MLYDILMDVSRVQKEVPQMLLENFPTIYIHDFATNISLGKDYDLCFENYIFNASIKRANTLIIYLYYLFVSHQDNVCKKNYEYLLQ